MKKEIIIICAIVLFTASSASAAITIYPNDRSGWESTVGVYEEEFFTDTTLNPGVSVVSEYPGYVDTIKGVWWDRLVCPYYGLTTTIWQFDTPIIGYGGNWNPGVPGGPGAHIAVAINGSWVSVGEIPRTYTGQFWGFVSTEPFSAVRLNPGSYCYPLGGAWCETYELDSMVYSPQVPVGRIFPDKAVKLSQEVIEAPYLWGGKGYDPFVTPKMFLDSPTIKDTGYNYWNPEKGKKDFGRGLDCSGLSFWSYNRAYYGGEELSADEFENRPLYWFGANGQCIGNIEDNPPDKCIYKELKKEELKPGDLLFFDAEIRKDGKFVKYGQDGVVDHVAMYVGEFTCKENCYCDGEKCDVIESTIWKNKIIGTTIDKIIQRIESITGEKAFVRSGHVTDAKLPKIEIIVRSPVDLIVIAPDGEVITKEIGESPTMEYIVYDINGDGELDDIIASPKRKIGDYSIQVVPEPDALPTDTYSLEVTANGQTIVLAENVSISEIPRTPYIIRSTKTEIILVIPAFVDFDPDTLNLKSKGRWVTSYIELPVGYDINKIDLESIRLNDQISIEPEPIEISDYDGNGISDLMVKFNRLAAQKILEVGDEVKITITGELINGKPFEGSDIIRVISKGKE